MIASCPLRLAVFIALLLAAESLAGSRHQQQQDVANANGDPERMKSSFSFGLHSFGAEAAREKARRSESSRRTGNDHAHAQPTWPTTFITDWLLYHVPAEDPMPPYSNGAIPTPHRTGRGRTFYDWRKFALLEEYYDFCVPIFVEGFNFTCHFLNIGNVSYFVTFDDRPSWAPACCIFGKPWLPPSPSTVSSELPFYKKEEFLGRPVNWYRTTPPTGLVFGYGFYADMEAQPPAEFFFNAQQGWALQDFHNFSSDVPPEEKWEVPAACDNVKVCNLPH